MLPRTHPGRRRGVASIELAFVTMLFIVPMILGIWEVGRYIQVRQIISNSAREASRLAAQGFTIKSDGTQTQVKTTTGSPNLRDTVYDYLRAVGLANLQLSDVTVTFAFQPATGYDSSLTEPYMGKKGQPFDVTVSIPWHKVRWINLGLLNPTKVEFTATWRMLNDDDFSVNETLPGW